LVFIMLALCGVAGALITFRARSDKAELVATYFTAGALVMVADWVAFGWFAFYSYHPGLARDPNVDGVLGEFLAEIVFVPGALIVLLTFLTGWRQWVVGGLLFGAIEWVFVGAGLLILHGWRTWYTVAGFAIYCVLLGRFESAVRRRGLDQPWIRAVTRVALIFWMIAVLTLVLRGTRWVSSTGVNVMPTPMGNQALGRFVTYLPVSLPLGYWILAGDRHRRPLRILTMLMLAILINYGFIATRLQSFRRPWGPVSDAVAQTGAIVLACGLDNWIAHLARRQRTKLR
jgi:hypothetical protein